MWNLYLLAPFKACISCLGKEASDKSGKALEQGFSAMFSVPSDNIWCLWFHSMLHNYGLVEILLRCKGRFTSKKIFWYLQWKCILMDYNRRKLQMTCWVTKRHLMNWQIKVQTISSPLYRLLVVSAAAFSDKLVLSSL